MAVGTGVELLSLPPHPPPPRQRGGAWGWLGCVGLACTQAAWGPTLSRPRGPLAEKLLKVTPGVL